MRRSDFIKMSALSIPAVFCGAILASPLQRWVRRFGAEVTSSGAILMIGVKLEPGRVAEALHSLDGISDGVLRCAGAEVRGQSGDVEFVLRIV